MSAIFYTGRTSRSTDSTSQSVVRSYQESKIKMKKMRRVVETVFLIGAGLTVLYQVNELIQIYQKYEVKTQIAFRSQNLIELPYFTFCFRIMQTLNASKIFQRHPNILAQVEHMKSTQEGYRNWSAIDILEDYNVGENIIFGQLTVAEISKVILPLSSIFSKCTFLTKELVRKECTESNFVKSFYDQFLCYTFGTISRSELPKFSLKSIQVPGYRGLILFDVHLNLTRISRINHILVAAHRSPILPWYSGFHSMEIFPEPDRLQDYALTYQESYITYLPHPYDGITNCSDHSVGICYSRCFMRKFVRITHRYPRYFVISQLDRAKMMNGYTEMESYLTLASELYKSCRKICGSQDCRRVFFRWNVIGRPKLGPYPGKLVIIHIYPPSAPAVYREHQPKITFQKLLVSASGIINVWFGLSLVSLLRLADRYSRLGNESWAKKVSKHRRKRNKVLPLQFEVVRFEKINSPFKVQMVNGSSIQPELLLTRFNTDVYGSTERRPGITESREVSQEIIPVVQNHRAVSSSSSSNDEESERVSAPVNRCHS